MPLKIVCNDITKMNIHACYRKSLQLAKKYGIQSIAFPLISTGGFGYPKEEGMWIAVDKINAFLLGNDMLIYLVVFDRKSTMLGEKLFLDLDESKDLLARAGYALSSCDKTDIIFAYFIENEIYDMIGLDIQLEEHGLPCVIS